MHVPDGYFTAPLSIAAGVVAAGVVAVSLRGARNELDERTTPMAGLTAAFIFAVQMLNFPVGFGTSGHLLGGALAAILVGPYTGILSVTVVLAVQALVFADGGLTALGINIILISFVPAVVGYLTFRAVLRAVPRERWSVPWMSGTAAFVSVPVAAAVFVGLFVVGGVAEVPLGLLAGTMIGIHALIGIGEGLITALIVGTVVGARPDLVYAARDLLPRQQPHVTSPASQPQPG